MRSQQRWLVFLMVCMSLAAAGVFTGKVFSAAPEGTDGTERCIKKVSVTRAQNPFRVSDSMITKEKDAGTVRAVDDMSGYSPVEAVSQYAVRGDMLMGIRRGTGKAAVNGRYFSDLNRVDATMIEPGQRKEIGRLLPASTGSVPMRNAALFLLESQVVRTYWHVESVLCLADESDSADAYRAVFRGIHKYYTNSYNEEKLDFIITIEKKTGVIALIGGP